MTLVAGRYCLLERIGEGGAGIVWLAQDQKLEREVALKVLRPLVAADLEHRQRFAREARVLAQLSNDHIVRVFDFVDDGEQAVLVMEHVDGVNLGQATAKRLPLPLPEAAGYLAPVAHALAYAHAKGVIHRDLAPSNVLIERHSGRVVTTDFGLARLVRSSSTLTATGTLIGTPEYWSPEQARGRSTNGATDIYALGCILFLLLSGRLPFEGDDRLAVGLRRAHEPAPSLRERRPEAAPQTTAFVDSLLAHDPADRPSASAVASVLAELAGGAHLPTGDVDVDLPVAPTTVAFLPEKPTTVLATPAQEDVRTRPRKRVLLAAFAVSAAATLGGFFLYDTLTGSALHAPRVVALREGAARARIHRSLPGTEVEVARTYSLRVRAGRVIRQEPSAGEQIARGSLMRLVVSKGTPFADIPAVSPGVPPSVARAVLAGNGFTAQYRFTPSWSIRKGAVIELRPRPGTRLRRPSRVKIVIASGYPRAVVPNVQNADVVAAQAQLLAKHLNYRVVYRVQHDVPANEVIGQIPAAGATVYRGTRVRLTVARTLRWKRVLAQTGAASYESDPFTVPAHWRIRYRLDPGPFGAGVAQLTWRPDDAFFGGDGFVATGANGLQTRAVSDGAGTYRLAVDPYAGTGWYVEVDALR
ncbi:MAG TPA: protein kinase [Gaiellaceae bacterium]|jgi:serine/threonine-protein kinase